MATFEITDQKTGKQLTIEGEVPPTPADIDAIFGNITPPQAAAPSPARQPSATPGALVNELIAGGARSVASMGDILTSPFQAFMLATGKPVPSLESMVTRPGAFAGTGTASAIAGKVGELTTAGVSSGAAARSAVTAVLDDAARYGESAFRGVLRQLGASTLADDALAAASSAAVSTAGESAGSSVGGATGGQVGQMVGGIVGPAALIPSIKRLTRQVEPLIREAAPSTAELRGASRALFKQVEDLGIVFSEDATKKIANQLQSIATKESLTNLKGESVLAGQYKKALDLLTSEGNYTGTTFSVVDKIRVAFKDIANGTDNEARVAKLMTEAVDDWLTSPQASDIASTAALAAPGAAFGADVKQTVGPALNTARALWRRAKAGELMQDALNDAVIASTGRGAQEYETAVLNNMRSLLRRPDADTRFTSAEKQLIADTVKGGGIRRTLELLSKFGVQSHDYVKVLLAGTVGGTIASGQLTPQVAATVGTTLAGLGVGTAAGSIASRMLRTDAATLNAMIKAGPNAPELARLYMQKTPPKERSAVELSALFKTAGADLSALAALPISKSALVSDAVALTAAWDSLEAEEAQK